MLSKEIETRIRQIVTETVAEAMELDERWREDDEAEWHQSIAGQTQQPQRGIAAKPQQPAVGGADTVQKARQLVALATQMVARKNPVMARHIGTLATQFEDLIKQPSPENNAKAMKLAGQISSLAKSIK
jgi:hypothetical protein